MSSKNDAVVRAVVPNNAGGLSVTMHPFRETELVNVRAGLDVAVVEQDFTFTRKGADGAVVTETRTQRYVPQGVARYLVKKSAEDDGTLVEYVYYTSDGIEIPFVYNDGTVRDTLFGLIDDVKKRPFRDLGTYQKLGGAFDTVKTGLHTTGLTNYFFKSMDEAPGTRKSGSSAVPFSATVDNATKNATTAVLANIAQLESMGIALTDDQKAAMLDGAIKAATDAAVAERKAKIEASNAKNAGKMAPIDPETLTSEKSA